MAGNLSLFARGRTFRERVGARESLHYRNCDGKRPDCAYVWARTVLIAGGGIGGLTTALCLHAAGIDAVVYEAAPAMRELGVGIDLLPHAVRAAAP